MKTNFTPPQLRYITLTLKSFVSDNDLDEETSKKLMSLFNDIRIQKVCSSCNNTITKKPETLYRGMCRPCYDRWYKNNKDKVKPIKWKPDPGEYKPFRIDERQ